MTRDEKVQAMHLLAAVLQDNAGQRLTTALINGILTTVDVQIPFDQPGQPQVQEVSNGPV